MSGPEGAASATFKSVLRTVGTLLGLHVQHAQREAKGDLGRVLKGVVLVLVGALLAAFALAMGHVAAMLALTELTVLTPWQAAAAVAGGDLLAGVILASAGRAALKRPILKETRLLVRKTVTSLADV